MKKTIAELSSEIKAELDTLVSKPPREIDFVCTKGYYSYSDNNVLKVEHKQHSFVKPSSYEIKHKNFVSFVKGFYSLKFEQDKSEYVTSFNSGAQLALKHHLHELIVYDLVYSQTFAVKGRSWRIRQKVTRIVDKNVKKLDDEVILYILEKMNINLYQGDKLPKEYQEALLFLKKEIK